MSFVFACRSFVHRLHYSSLKASHVKFKESQRYQTFSPSAKEKRQVYDELFFPDIRTGHLVAKMLWSSSPFMLHSSFKAQQKLNSVSTWKWIFIPVIPTLNSLGPPEISKTNQSHPWRIEVGSYQASVQQLRISRAETRLFRSLLIWTTHSSLRRMRDCSWCRKTKFAHRHCCLINSYRKLFVFIVWSVDSVP